MNKQYWKNLEELKDSPEHRESLSKEFQTPPLQDVSDTMERRDFLKLAGAATLLATIGCSRRPTEKIIPYVNKPEEITPGVPTYYASTCGECSAGCGILVKTREGRPIKLEGNDLHPLNQGSLCARGQASLLGLYDPDRIRGPLAVIRLDGTTSEADWSTVDRDIQQKLSRVRSEEKKVVVLTGVITSPTTKKLIADFLSGFSEGEHVAYDPTVPEEVAIAQELAFGIRLVPRYRFEKAKLVVSFGADFLGTWLSPVEFTKGFSASRDVDRGRMSRLVVCESSVSLTGTNADEYVPLQAGDEVSLALALASAISSRLENVHPTIQEKLRAFDMKTVAGKTGMEAGLLRSLADELWKTRGDNIVVGGGIKSKHALALQVAVNLLNTLLGNDGTTIDWEHAPSSQAESSFAGVLRLTREMKAGKIGALIVESGDPLFSFPAELGLTEGLKNVSLVVSLSDRMTETAKGSDFICPVTHPLESWGESEPQKGVRSLMQPTVAPLYNNRSFQDSLIAWGVTTSSTWHEMLKSAWGDAWEKTLERGVVSTSSRDSISKSRTFRPEALAVIPPLPVSTDTTLSLVPAFTTNDGRSLNNPWLMELPDPVSKITWENYLSVAPAFAKDNNLDEGDVVECSTQTTTTTLPIHIQPKLHSRSVVTAVGFGQTHAGRVGAKAGSNTYPFQKVVGALVEWCGIPVTIKKTSEKILLASTQSHHNVAGRPIIAETTWKAFQHDPSSGIPEAHELPSMWPGHEYKGHRWGMVIDMNSCTGCSACITACQAENNIPTVGKKQVAKSREMHWIRIDRYHSGDEENPEVVNQPMLCQQCENAPCETVCPTLATFHSDDGLNMMSYNRCVGTRYCSNNCPYKVRRFNFFEYHKDITESMQLAMNPDVTMRTRGVMEKCTFCIQRIRVGTDRATMDGRALADGDIKTACQQTCPANAITFGDLNDPTSKVAKLAKNKRGYHVLAELNTRPSVTYLSKVRNKS